MCVWGAGGGGGGGGGSRIYRTTAKVVADGNKINCGNIVMSVCSFGGEGKVQGGTKEEGGWEEERG